MLHVRNIDDIGELEARLREAAAANATAVNAVIGTIKNSARLAQLIRSGAWTDAALVLIALERPLWQVRRLAYDDGEWHCALSRERELPDWLDQSIEARHTDLALAILSALVEARRLSVPESRTSVPDVRRNTHDICEVLPVDNHL